MYNNLVSLKLSGCSYNRKHSNADAYDNTTMMFFQLKFDEAIFINLVWFYKFTIYAFYIFNSTLLFSLTIVFITLIVLCNVNL